MNYKNDLGSTILKTEASAAAHTHGRIYWPTVMIHELLQCVSQISKGIEDEGTARELCNVTSQLPDDNIYKY